jgi:hypothetical protein
MSVEEFENAVQPYFTIEKQEVVGPMIQYFITSKKHCHNSEENPAIIA